MVTYLICLTIQKKKSSPDLRVLKAFFFVILGNERNVNNFAEVYSTQLNTHLGYLDQVLGLPKMVCGVFNSNESRREVSSILAILAI